MAKQQYIVNTSIQGRDGKGNKFLIPRSSNPQDIPATLVKELLARGAIELPNGSAGDDGDDVGGDDEGSGD